MTLVTSKSYEEIRRLDRHASPNALRAVMRGASSLTTAVTAWQANGASAASGGFCKPAQTIFPLFRPLLSERHVSMTIDSVARLLRIASLTRNASK